MHSDAWIHCSFSLISSSLCHSSLPDWVIEIGRELLRDCTDVTLTYNPEFIAQGDIIHGLLNPDMVLIGEGDKRVGDWLEVAYGMMTENKPTISRMSAESAEICKLSLNCFITMKISYALSHSLSLILCD